MTPIFLRLWRAVAFLIASAGPGLAAAEAPMSPQRQLEAEVSRCGWLLFSARSQAGDYDLFLARPDGSDRRAMTRTPEWSEYGGRFSPDSRRILYRRLPRGPEIVPGESIDHDAWGGMGVMVIANADGTGAEVMGKEGELPWASWSPDGRQLACLHKREGRIRLVDVTTRQTVRELRRQGIFQQMYWSPDGKRLCGTANFSGQDWNVVSLEIATGEVTLLSRGLNCTPDWFRGDANRVVYSNRTPGIETDYGWTMLMEASADGKERSLLYAERGRHVYYGCTSPDNRYVVFSAPPTDGGTDGLMAIIRRADAPIILPEDYRQLKALHPNAKPGPVFRLAQAGFEPDWTYAELGAPVQPK